MNPKAVSKAIKAVSVRRCGKEDGRMEMKDKEESKHNSSMVSTFSLYVITYLSAVNHKGKTSRMVIQLNIFKANQ